MDDIDWIFSTFAATIMSVAYGITVTESGDPYISRAEESLEGLSIAGVPGTFLVDFIPILKYVPSWFPGASFKRKAAHWRKINDDLTEIPFKHVENLMVLSRVFLFLLYPLNETHYVLENRQSPSFVIRDLHRALATCD